MAQDVVSLLRGREGDHRCELNCEWVEGEADSTPDEARLLDPRTSAWTVQLEARVAGSLDKTRRAPRWARRWGPMPCRANAWRSSTATTTTR